ncbi:MAG: hypothetical protein WCP95_11530 [Actinomycetes bacterium]
MTHPTRRFLIAVATIVTVAVFSATDAFAREAPPEIGPFPPRPHMTTPAPLLDQVTWLVAGAVLGMAVAALAVAAYTIARRHRQQTSPVTAS